MGSGTTIGEAHKLGFTAFGRDINPVAVESVKAAFGPFNPKSLQIALTDLTQSIGRRIQKNYTAPRTRAAMIAMFYITSGLCKLTAPTAVQK